jgi:hypothetical protein
MHCSANFSMVGRLVERNSYPLLLPILLYPFPSGPCSRVTTHIMVILSKQLAVASSSPEKIRLQRLYITLTCGPRWEMHQPEHNTSMEAMGRIIPIIAACVFKIQLTTIQLQRSSTADLESPEDPSASGPYSYSILCGRRGRLQSQFACCSTY